MKMRSLLAATLAVTLTTGLAATADAALLNRGGGLIFDSDLNVTWLQNTDAWGTRGNWAVAEAWATGFSYDDTVRGVTYTDWRLPSALNNDGSVCSGFNCTQTEMGHLFYTELGNTAQMQPANVNVGDFSGIVTDATGVYWTSSSEVGFYWGGTASNVGNQGAFITTALGYAWLVRDGDVVPEPTSVVLIGSALIGLVGFRRRWARS